MKIRDRIKEFKRVKASELAPNPKNWRTHPKGQKDALQGLLAEIGFAGAVLARETPSGLMLIDGHLRAETAATSEIPVLILDVSELEADKILATFDPLGSMAEKNAEQLSNLLRDLKAHEDTMAALVWPDYVMDPLLSADWNPPEDDGSNEFKKEEDRAVTFSEEQWEVVHAAYEISEEPTLAGFLCARVQDD